MGEIAKRCVSHALTYLWVVMRVATLRPAAVVPHLKFGSWQGPIFLGIAALMSGLRWGQTGTPPIGIAAAFLLEFGVIACFGRRARQVVLAYAAGSALVDLLGMTLPGGSGETSVRYCLSFYELCLFLRVVFSSRARSPSRA